MIGHDRPQRAPRVGFDALHAGGVVSQGTARAVGHHHEIVKPVTLPRETLDHRLPAITRGVQILHVDAGAHRHAVLLARGLEEHVEQHAAMQADAEERRVKLRVLELHHLAAGRGLHPEPVDAIAPGHHVLLEAQRAEHRHAAGLQHDARAQRLRLGDLLVKGDPVTLASQEQCGGTADSSGAHHGDIEKVHQGRGCSASGRPPVGNDGAVSDAVLMGHRVEARRRVPRAGQLP